MSLIWQNYSTDHDRNLDRAILLVKGSQLMLLRGISLSADRYLIMIIIWPDEEDYDDD